MSSFKKLNKADVTSVSYAANKQWNLTYVTTSQYYDISNVNDGYAVQFYGANIPFKGVGDNISNNQYPSLVYDQINHLFYQQYTSSLDTGSIMFNIDTYESASQQRPTASYFNYNTNPLLIKNFPSGASGEITGFSINKNIYGSKILPGSLRITIGEYGSLFYDITDDGNGNLYDNLLTQFVGNVFYAHGLIVLTELFAVSYFLQGASSPTTLNISFQNEHTVYENEVRCIIKESDYNLSYNPTLLEYGGQYITELDPCYSYTVSASNSAGFTINYIDCSNTSQSINVPSTGSFTFCARQGTVSVSTNTGGNWVTTGGTTSCNSGSIYYTLAGSFDSTVKNFATSSAFQPYVTTIGLYNDDNDLLMVAKLAKPIALSSDTDMTFIVKYDT